MARQALDIGTEAYIYGYPKEPYILSIPDAHDRYYLLPMLSAWTDVFEAGQADHRHPGGLSGRLRGPLLEASGCQKGSVTL